MAKSVLELAVDTGKWEGGIRKAQTALNNFTKDQGGLQQALQKNSGKVRDFLSIMGNVESKANTAKGKMNEYKNVIAQLDSMQRQLNETDRQAFGPDFQRAIDSVRAKFHAAKVEVDELNASLNNVRPPQIGGVGTGGGMLAGLDMKSMAGSLVGFATATGAAVAAANTVKDAIAYNIETAKNFEKSISSLSSLTGMTGGALDDLKKKAIELGGSTTQTASQVAESFQLIGSKMPELLKDADALQAVTKAAITLAEASGDDVTTSANALTAALNIMGEGADSASRYINVLAAGSQKGTRNIQELTDIVFRAGQSARSTGISFEQLIAIAAAGTKEFDSAESAGQALSKLFIQIEKQSNDQLKPSVVGLSTALENLAKEDYGVVEATKLFTKNGAMAYRSIVNNKDAILETLPAITDTNIAFEQAAVNTDNLDGALKRLSSAWEEFNLSLNDSNSMATILIDMMTEWVHGLNDTTVAIQNIAGAFSDAAGEAGGLLDIIKKIARYTGGGGAAGDLLRRFAPDGGSSGQPSSAGTPTTTGSNGNRSGKTGNSGSQDFDDSTAAGIRAHIKHLKELRETADIAGQEYANLTAEIARLQALLAPHKATATKVKSEKFDASTGIAPVVPTLRPTAPSTEAFDQELKQMFNPANLDGFISDVSKKLKDAPFGTDIYDNISSQLADATALKNLMETITKNGLDGLDSEMSQMWGELLKGEDVSDESVQGIVEKINEKLKEMKLDPINIDVKTGSLEKIKDNKEIAKNFSEAAGAVQALGSALNGIEDPTAKVMGTVAMAIATIASTFAQSLKTSFSVWDWIAGAAAGAATMTSTIAAIKSATEYHADGGVVGQSGLFTPRGTDTVPAMLTPGEIVLTAANQQNLANQLSGTTLTATGGEFKMRLVGTQLIGVINNTLKDQGKHTIG